MPLGAEKGRKGDYRVTVANTHGHNTCKGLGRRGRGGKGRECRGDEREGTRCHCERKKGEKGILGWY